jgi:phage shock protein PspC (stress-responsive transcriptional regulator)/FtsH-binding integral membrane protein
MPKQTPPAPDTETEPKPAHEPSGHRFFAWIRSLNLRRQPGWIGGVSAGIADRLGIDVLIVRGILVVIAVLGGPAVLLYAAAWLLLPDDHDRIHLEDLFRGKIEAPVVAIAVLVALSLLPVTQGFWWFGSLYWGQPHWGDSVGRAIWSLVILAALVWLVVWFSKRSGRGASAGTVASTSSASGTDAADDPTSSPATTDDQPDTIPSLAVPGAPVAPPRPAADASTDELTVWRERQKEWKSEYNAFRGQQDAEKQAANRAAAARAREERMARWSAERQARARTRSHPLYSVILIGVALVSGALTALVLGNGTPDPSQILAGIAITIGVLGLGVVVNGATGRRSGGATGLAIVLLIPLAVAGVFPQSSTLRYAGPTELALHRVAGEQTRSYHQLFGNLDLDLSSYYSTPRPTKGHGYEYSSIEIWVGAGNVTVTLPRDEYEYLSARSASGTITAENGSRHDGGYNTNVNVDGQTNSNKALRQLGVNVYVGSGNIRFVEATTSKGATK